MSTRLEDAETDLRCFDGAAALVKFDQALRKNPKDVRASAGRVRALWMLRRWDEARSQLAALDNRNDAQVALARGLVALGQPDDPSYLSVDCGSAGRDDDAAVEAFRSAVELDESSGEALAGLAAAYRMSGQLGKAEEVLRDARPSLRSSAPVLVESAMGKLERDDRAGAEADVELAIEDDPGCLQAELLRIEVARQADDDTENLVARTEALVNRRPGPAAVVLELHGWALLERAEATNDHGLRERAVEVFARAEQTGPSCRAWSTGRR